MEENAAAKEMIEADNKAEEMIKKRQAACKSSYLKIFFGFSVGELKAMGDELKKRRNIKAECNKASLLKSTYQEELILLLAEECKKSESQTSRA
ncbi:MAG: hypothetical protein LBN19_01565 [Endomicrobium sp.]|jgi:hypothetical protein|nr:hypothetical protein [Endomicrobium sp.]